MHDQTRYQMELAGESATLYILERIAETDGPALAALCRELPEHVRTLRVDMRAVGTMTAEAMRAVRALLAGWRARRDGRYDLRTSYLVATCRQLETAA